MKNTKELNIFITIVLILICSYIICSLMIKKENFTGDSSQVLEAKQTMADLKTQFSQCMFKAKGNTLQSCKDRCLNPVDKVKHGGDFCTVDVCNQICNTCQDKPRCKWLDTDKNDVPDKIEIVMKRNNNDNPVLYWTQPYCPKEYPILYYIIVVESDQYTDKVRVNTFKPPEKVISNEYEIFNLKPIDNKNTIYNISIYSRNSNGYSSQSNKIRFIRLKPNEVPDQDQVETEQTQIISKNIYTDREKREIYKLIENKLS